MNAATPLRTLGALLTLAAALATPAAAQSLTLEASGGLATGASDPGAPQRPGPAFAAGVGLALTPGIAVRVDVSGSAMEEGRAPDNGATIPGINLIHLVAGVEAPLARSAVGRRSLTLSGNVGGGISRYDVEAFAVPEGRPQAGRTYTAQETYPTVNGGLRLALAATSSLDLVLSAQAFHTFLDRDDTAVLALISDAVEAPRSSRDVPVTLGIRLRL